jgi:hypothetical protein
VAEIVTSGGRRYMGAQGAFAMRSDEVQVRQSRFISLIRHSAKSHASGALATSQSEMWLIRSVRGASEEIWFELW